MFTLSQFRRPDYLGAWNRLSWNVERRTRENYHWQTLLVWTKSNRVHKTLKTSSVGVGRVCIGISIPFFYSKSHVLASLGLRYLLVERRLGSLAFLKYSKCCKIWRDLLFVTWRLVEITFYRGWIYTEQFERVSFLSFSKQRKQGHNRLLLIQPIGIMVTF